eukprot:2541461-Amphidinium_carterae.1
MDPTTHLLAYNEHRRVPYIPIGKDCIHCEEECRLKLVKWLSVGGQLDVFIFSLHAMQQCVAFAAPRTVTAQLGRVPAPSTTWNGPARGAAVGKQARQQQCFGNERTVDDQRDVS